MPLPSQPRTTLLYGRRTPLRERSKLSRHNFNINFIRRCLLVSFIHCGHNLVHQPLLLLRGEKNTTSTLIAKQNNELYDTPLASALWAITSQFCHLNLFFEKRHKNRSLRLFSAEGNKRGLYQFSKI